MTGTKIVHRIAMPGDGRSMWYDRDGFFCPVVPEVERFPMPLDQQRIALDVNGTWLSSVDDPNALALWFPDGLVDRLKALGFVQRVFEVQHWVDLPNETVFRLDTAREVTA